VDNADTELERSLEPVRYTVRRQSADGRPQLELTYTECLELPKMEYHSHHGTLARLSLHLEELFSQVSDFSARESLPQDLADEIGTTAGEIMVELVNHRSEGLIGNAIRDAQRLRDVVRTVHPKSLQVTSKGRALIEDLAAILHER